MMPKCKSCGAPIEFIKMTSGKTMPVEVTQKSVWVKEAGIYYLYKGQESHFINCPNANKHRKPKTTSQKVGPLGER